MFYTAGIGNRFSAPVIRYGMQISPISANIFHICLGMLFPDLLQGGNLVGIGHISNEIMEEMPMLSKYFGR